MIYRCGQDVSPHFCQSPSNQRSPCRLYLHGLERESPCRLESVACRGGGEIRRKRNERQETSRYHNGAGSGQIQRGSNWLLTLSAEFGEAGVEFVVAALEGEQIVVVAALDDFAVFKHHNGI